MHYSDERILTFIQNLFIIIPSRTIPNYSNSRTSQIWVSKLEVKISDPVTDFKFTTARKDFLGWFDILILSRKLQVTILAHSIYQTPQIWKAEGPLCRKLYNTFIGSGPTPWKLCFVSVVPRVVTSWLGNCGLLGFCDKDQDDFRRMEIMGQRFWWPEFACAQLSQNFTWWEFFVAWYKLQLRV